MSLLYPGTSGCEWNQPTIPETNAWGLLKSEGIEVGVPATGFEYE
jgi:hypothetical protein